MRRFGLLGFLPVMVAASGLSLAALGGPIPSVDVTMGPRPYRSRPSRPAAPMHGRSRGPAAKPKRKTNRLTLARKAKARRRRARKAA